MAILTVLNGIVVSFIRAIIGLILVVLNLQIVNRPMTASWIQTLVQIDLPSLSYISEVYIYHLHFSPISRAYANIIANNHSQTPISTKKVWALFIKSKCIEKMHHSKKLYN